MDGIRLVLEKEATLGGGPSESRTLATNVEIAESSVKQARGLMFRSVPEEFALVMEVGNGGMLSSSPARQFVHMLFVRESLDVLWLVDDEVVKVARMHPWRSFAVAKANRIVELPAGGAEDAQAGDRVRLVDPDE